MATVHVFSSTRRFASFEARRAFVDATYSEDGDIIPSPFMNEVGLSSYEPMCIEVTHALDVLPLKSLLAGASHGEQWLDQLDPALTATEAICVFEPNELERPFAASSVNYCGAFDYCAD